MKIAVNGKSLGIFEKGGAVRVAINLIKHIALVKPEIELHVFTPYKSSDINMRFPTNVKFHSPRFPISRNQVSRAIWEQLYLPIIVRYKRQFTLLLNLTNTAPVIITPKIPQILLVHDIGFMNTEWFSKSFSIYTNLIISLATCNEVQFVSVTKSMAKQINRKFPRSGGVMAISNAADEPPLDLPEISFKGNYILFLGSINPRKNLKGAISGFQIFRKATNSNIQMVVIGAQKLIFADHDLNCIPMDGVCFIGYIDDIDKWAWIKRAELLVLPSFLEGFGLPVLEAMKMGTPTVVSDIPEFRELYGNAVEYVNPSCPKDIANGIQRVLKSPRLKDQMIKKGLEVEKKFSWKNSAEEYLRLFDKVLNGNENI
jgi:glycosyltransferase involved in cell wall biosynthesis